MVMTQFTSLANQFLIAMPTLMDPNFHRSVTYICEHNANGAMGIVINRSLDLRFGEVLDQMSIDVTDTDALALPVFLGGPVHTDRGFVIHRPMGKWDSTLRVTDKIGLTTSRDIVAAVAAGKGPKNCLIALGYAGWGAGQLEKEMADNAWLSGPADPRVMFEVPIEQRWEIAAAARGVDRSRMSNDVGHA
jgi:putative transcriptional regulator